MCLGCGVPWLFSEMFLCVFGCQFEYSGDIFPSIFAWLATGDLLIRLMAQNVKDLFLLP